MIFGSEPSPYILNAILEKHFDQYEEQNPETVKSLQDDTYVNNIQYGGNTETELQKFKEESIIIFKEGGFSLHIWHSNIQPLEKDESDECKLNKDTITFAKESIGTKETETKILGLPWNKTTDEIHISF